MNGSSIVIVDFEKHLMDYIESISVAIIDLKSPFLSLIASNVNNVIEHHKLSYNIDTIVKHRIKLVESTMHLINYLFKH